MKTRNLCSALSIAIAALSSTNIFAQNGYTVHGNIKGWDDHAVYLILHVNDSLKIDSTAVTDGKFSFTGNVPNPLPAYISNQNKSKIFTFYLENSDINISGTVDSLHAVKITGSQSQDEADELTNSQKEIDEQEEIVYKKYQDAESNNDSAKVGVYMKQLDSLDNISTETTKHFIETHPKSVVSLAQLQPLTYSEKYSELKNLYDGLDTSVKKTEQGAKFAKRLEVLEKVQEGNPALAFTQKDTSGNAIGLSDFKGKYVLIDFWASWCGPCRAENPNVVKTYNKFKDRNFTILGVSLDRTADKWKKAIVHDNLTWAEISQLNGWQNEAAVEYGVQAIPANFLIDPNGIIIGHNLRGEDLENKLAEILK